MRVLVTGGNGFIGSHTVASLINSGHEPIIIDNLSNSSEGVVGRIGELTGVVPEFHKVDIRDTERVAGVLDEIDACIHFAALKSVGESVEEPLRYYDNNVSGTISLLAALREANVKQFIFSSSATVYGEAADLPLREDMPVGVATNPYGWSKIMMERVLIDVQTANPDWSICLLRYFNPVGAHPSGLIGEEPSGIPNNLMPYVAKVAAGELDHVRVFGNDYPTPDGTGVR
ncbi:MAG TPA: UDP-glucose 4-epimerase GalE, partial [Acidimicrobiia bacterium]